MADGLNKVMIIGNLGKDPEMRYLPNGGNVTKFTVAVSRTWKPADGGDRQEETEWFSVSAFGKLGETMNQYLTKGQKVYVEGRMRTSSWDDQNTGEKKYRTEMIAEEFRFLEARGGGSGGQSEGGYSNSGSVPEHDQGIDEMPF